MSCCSSWQGPPESWVMRLWQSTLRVPTPPSGETSFLQRPCTFEQGGPAGATGAWGDRGIHGRACLHGPVSQLPPRRRLFCRVFHSL